MAKESRPDAMGEELVRRDVITREELEEARAFEKSSGVAWYRQLLQAGKIGYSALEDSLRYEFHPKSRRDEHENLGDQLLSMGAVSREELNAALDEQKRSGRLLGNILEDRGIVSRRAKIQALARQHKMEYAELEDTPSDPAALNAVPESVALKNQMIPVRLEGDRLTVLVADPQMRDAMRDVSILLGLRVHPTLSCIDDVRNEIRQRYAEAGSAGQPSSPQGKQSASTTTQRSKPEAKAPAADRAGAKGSAKKETEQVSTTDEQAETASANLRSRLGFDEIAKQASGMPVIKLVQTIIEGAANSGATDVHLDPQEPEMRVRYRIDGVLHDVMSIDPEIENAVVSRVKLMSDLDITETRRPQDGHISVEIGDGEFDIRVATLPTFLGERVVLRLLDQSTVLAGVRDLGLESDDEKKMRRLIEQPYGMVLVTGPTGSGKTTSLYAALNQKNVLEDSIVTLEDPVEYQLSGINQVQIDPDIGVTFANTLRAALRQDIDVLLVGEIRDPETARIAIRAAMTGHLVFSTMHTNDAPEAITTLRNMGVPSYLIASAITAVVAQRLVRTICPECKSSFTVNKTLAQSVGLPQTVKRLHRGKGCDHCYQTGNKGRTGIFEVLEFTNELRKLVADDQPAEQIAKQAKLKTMAERCRQKMKRGEVAPEEFLRVIRT